MCPLFKKIVGTVIMCIGVALVSTGILLLLSGCASFDTTYMGSSTFVTAEECRIFHRLLISKQIKVKDNWNHVVECAHLPETIW